VLYLWGFSVIQVMSSKPSSERIKLVMKRTIAATLGSVAITSTPVAQQGHAMVWNYYSPPYNQVVWDANVPDVGGTPVLDTSVLMNFWIAPGVVRDENELFSSGQPSFSVNPSITYDGGG